MNSYKAFTQNIKNYCEANLFDCMFNKNMEFKFKDLILDNQEINYIYNLKTKFNNLDQSNDDFDIVYEFCYSKAINGFENIELATSLDVYDVANIMKIKKDEKDAKYSCRFITCEFIDPFEDRNDCEDYAEDIISLCLFSNFNFSVFDDLLEGLESRSYLINSGTDPKEIIKNVVLNYYKRILKTL